MIGRSNGRPLRALLPQGGCLLRTPEEAHGPHSGVCVRRGRVSRWKDGAMVLRWAATAFLDAEKLDNIFQYGDLRKVINSSTHLRKYSNPRKSGNVW